MRKGEGQPADDVALLRRVLDAMPNGILMLDRDNVVVQANAFALEAAPTLAPGTPVRPALEQITHTEMVDRLLIRREVSTFSGRPDGPEYHWMVSRTRNDFGEIVLTFWDTDWSEVMNERRATFTMASSHELRGPLTTIQGFAEILNMHPENLSPEQQEAAGIVERTARHLSVLVEDTFDLSRNSFGELRLNLGKTDLEAVVAEVASSTRPGIEARGQSLDCEIAGPLPVVEADEDRTLQMITNLVGNASVHNGEGVSIRVHARVDGDSIAVTVADDGRGLPFEDPEDAFRTFRRGPGSTVGDRSGSGIGLSLAKRLIQLHRGHIEVESTPGRGASFTLYFPLDRDRALAPDEPGPA